MKKVGLYFGSFNPITTGHMLVAQEALLNLDEVWFVLSPQNPHKEESGLLCEKDRLSMLLTAISDSKNENFVSCHVELTMDKPSYTYKTIDKLKSMHPDHLFHIITGTDAYMSVPSWKRGIDLLKNIPFIIVKRGNKDEFHLKEDDIVLEGCSTMSATLVRDKIKKGERLGYLVPGGVEDIINKNGFYK